MARPGKHKSKYDKYKNAKRKEANKLKRAEKHKKRLEKFEKRKAEGKCYKYDPQKTKQKIADAGYNVNSAYYKENEFEIRELLFGHDKLDLSKLTSTMRRLDDSIREKEELERRKRQISKV